MLNKKQNEKQMQIKIILLNISTSAIINATIPKKEINTPIPIANLLTFFKVNFASSTLATLTFSFLFDSSLLTTTSSITGVCTLTSLTTTSFSVFGFNLILKTWLL